MKPEFSFNYGEKEYTFAVENGKVYELEKGVTITAVAKEYKEYNAHTNSPNCSLLIAAVLGVNSNLS